MSSFKFLPVFLLLASTLPAQMREPAPHAGEDVRPFRMQLDNFQHRIGSNPLESFAATESPSRSPFLAGLFSLVVPGTGEFYTQSYITGIIFLTLEAVGWYLNVRYNRRGDDQTGLYKQYADARWSVVRYAEWLNKYRTTFKGGENGVDIPINPDESLPPWNRVDWDAMNKTESVIPEFSHRLPVYGDQQYYELIGKYPQYNHGWDDSDPATAVYYSNLSKNFLDYAQMRGKANDSYTTAGTIGLLLVVNHILSAADAAWSATRFNARYQFHSRVQWVPVPWGLEPMPTASLNIRL